MSDNEDQTQAPEPQTQPEEPADVDLTWMVEIREDQRPRTPGEIIVEHKSDQDG